MSSPRIHTRSNSEAVALLKIFFCLLTVVLQKSWSFKGKKSPNHLHQFALLTSLCLRGQADVVPCSTKWAHPEYKQEVTMKQKHWCRCFVALKTLWYHKKTHQMKGKKVYTLANCLLFVTQSFSCAYYCRVQWLCDILKSSLYY